MDFDVAVLGLSSPPTSAFLTTYRPAVLVRNNGIHDALASGILRIYAAGQLVFTTEIYSATIPPGETREAQAVDYWTPYTEGAFTVIADASCPLDQDETNNHLAPTTVIVTSGTPPPPPTVTAHAAQHEEGGTDQLSIDGLRGRTYDAQNPTDHNTRHQQGGADEMSIAGLHGKAADGQLPDKHDNEAHARDFVDSDQVVTAIGVHNNTTAPHPTSTNLEMVIRKGAANGYTGLNAQGRVPYNQLQQLLASAVDTDCPRGVNTLLTSISLAASELQPGGRIKGRVSGTFTLEAGSTGTIWIILISDTTGKGEYRIVPIDSNFTGRLDVTLEATLNPAGTYLFTFGSGVAELSSAERFAVLPYGSTFEHTFDHHDPHSIKLYALLDTTGATDTLTIKLATLRIEREPYP